MSGYRESVFHPPEGVGLLSRLVFPILNRQIDRLLGKSGNELWRIVLILGAMFALMIGLVTFTIADPFLVWLDDGYDEPSIVYGVDADGNPAEYAEFFNFNRRLVTLTKDDMTTLPVVGAFIASEDTRFRSHVGVDFAGIVRAVFVNLAAGRIKEGASTITQQVSRLRFLDRERSFARKAREASLATFMELKYPKHKIMELYFNEVPLGHGALGVEAASQFFFKKPMRELSWGEATVISSLTTRPRDYSPLKYPLRSMEKIKVTFRRLVENGMLSPAQAESEYDNIIRNYFMVLNRYPDESSFSTRRNDFPYATAYLQSYTLPDTFKAGLNRQGYRIYTTLRVDKQPVAETTMFDALKRLNRSRVAPRSSFQNYQVFDDDFKGAIPILSQLFGIAPFKVKMTAAERDLRMKYLKEMREDLAFLGYLSGESNMIAAIEANLSSEAKNPDEKIEYIEGSLISVNPETGAIEAIVGGSGFTPGNQLLRFRSPRQPGSAFKPILFSAGLEYSKEHPKESKKFTAATVLEDSPIELPNADLSVYQPENYGGDYMGPIRMREALALSRNLWAVNAYLYLGGSTFNQYMEKFLSLGEGSLPREASIALGSRELSPMQMAAVYSMFPTGGYKPELYFIDRIESKSGEVLYQNPEIKRTQLMSAETAYIMTSVLRDVVDKGTGTAARIPGLPVAGKTGTTNRYGGAWFVGFVPDNVTVIQFAYDFNKTMGSGASGGSIAAPPWRQFTEKTYNRKVRRSYDMPKGVVVRPICSLSGQRPSDNCNNLIDEYFISGTEPKEICEIHTGSSSPKERLTVPDTMPSIDDSGF